jgi:type II secretory pathway pseudopilin PulG
LVVIAIIGILASIVMVSLTTAKAKGRDAKRVSDLRSIQLALELYYNDNAKFPLNIYAASNSLSPNYLAVVPTDPLNSGACSSTASGTSGAGCYSYSASNGTNNQNCGINTPPVHYHLGITLEDSSNIALTQDVDEPTNTFNGATITNCLNSNPDFSGADPVYDLTN